MAAGASTFQQRFLAGEFQTFFPLTIDQTDRALSLPRRPASPRLLAGLRRYAETLQAPAAVFENLSLLERSSARVVVTGQQAGLLLGPSYTLAKAITAIKLARSLTTPARPVVPVFWLASQDHDSAEIDHTYVLDAEESLVRLELPLPQGPPSGRIIFEPSWLASLSSQLTTACRTAPLLPEVLNLLEVTAADARTFADWFAMLLTHLLGSEGLVILDPMKVDIAPEFGEVLKDEIDNPVASVTAVREAGDALRARGVKPQLGRAERATNLFLEETLSPSSHPRRTLLRFSGQRFFTEHNHYTSADLLDRLTDDPAAITPAAALRPITQDAVLPTAVTVVGPGELRYFAQLKGVYEHHGVAMPLIWPRVSVTVLEPPVRRILAKYQLDSWSFLQDPEGHLQRVVLSRRGYGGRFERLLKGLENDFGGLVAEVRGIDPTLVRGVARAERGFERMVTKLRGKAASALVRQDAVTSGQFGRLRAHLLPGGLPQERVLSPFSFFLKFGVDPVIKLFLTLPPRGQAELIL